MAEQKRVYTAVERRKILAAVHGILNSQANRKRYSGTRWIDDTEDFNDPKALGFCDVLNCIAQMYKEMTAAEKEVLDDG